TADDVILEDIAGTGLPRGEVDLRVAVLTTPARLTDIAAIAVGRTSQRLLVGNLRLADARLDVELPLQAIDEDFEVQLPHPGDDGLGGLRVGVDFEGGILGHQLLQPLPEL